MANRVLPWIRLIRPQQWTKNLFVLATPFFGASLLDSQVLIRSLIALISFCLASGAAYAFNDAQDVQYDQKHPRKKHRPVALGLISPKSARLGALALGLIALLLSLQSSIVTTICIGTFLVFNVWYTLFFRHQIVLDVLVIAWGFLLRVLAGSGIPAGNTSAFLVACTGLTALLLAIGKRHSEIRMHGNSVTLFRPGLAKVSPRWTALSIGLAAVVLFSVYTVYALSATSRVAPAWSMATTVPFAGLIIGLYVWEILGHGAGEQPELLPFQSKPLLLSLLGYFLITVAVIYMVPLWKT